MISDGKKRVQVTFAESVLERLDEFCAETGMTRSAYIGYVVATSLDHQRQSVSSLAKKDFREVEKE